MPQLATPTACGKAIALDATTVREVLPSRAWVRNTQATLLADVVGRLRLSGYGTNGNGNGTVVAGNVADDRDRKVGSG